MLLLLTPERKQLIVVTLTLDQQVLSIETITTHCPIVIPLRNLLFLQYAVIWLSVTCSAGF